MIFNYLNGKSYISQDSAQRLIYEPTVSNPRPTAGINAEYGIKVGTLTNITNQAPLLFAETYIQPTANLYGGIPIWYQTYLQGTLPTTQTGG